MTPDHRQSGSARGRHSTRLRDARRSGGCQLVARLPVYPDYCARHARWLDAGGAARLVLRASDAEGWARADRWSPGHQPFAPAISACHAALHKIEHGIDRLLARAAGDRLEVTISRDCFLRAAANSTRWSTRPTRCARETSGGVVRYVVNRNINYTNICAYRCALLRLLQGQDADHLRGKPYDCRLEEVARRAREAWERGATEVCMQGGIHPRYTGQTYLDLLLRRKTARRASTSMPFRRSKSRTAPRRLAYRLSVSSACCATPASARCPEPRRKSSTTSVRAILCPDKLSTAEWLRCDCGGAWCRAADHSDHHVRPYRTPQQWAAHLLSIRDLQERTGGFTEFVPLPFVHMEAPIYFRGRARKGPTFRETLLMHAVARLALHPLITNIQVSWVKLGPRRRAGLSCGRRQ